MKEVIRDEKTANDNITDGGNSRMGVMDNSVIHCIMADNTIVLVNYK